MAKIQGKFAPLTHELGEDERFILESTDLDKLIYILIIYTCHMTNHQAPVNPDFYKIRYGLRSKRGQIVASLRRVRDMYPKLSWGDKNLSLLNSATYKNGNGDRIRKEEEKNKKEKKNKKDFSFFEKVWKTYPNQIGKKQAERHFHSSVKTEKDREEIQDALKNYQKHLEVNTWKPAQNGSTWFNNWKDWVNWKEPERREDAESRDDRLLKQVRGE